MDTPDPPNDTPGALKQMILTPHDIPWSLGVELFFYQILWLPSGGSLFSAWAFVTMPVAMLAAAFHDALEKRRLVGAKRRKEVCWYRPSIRRWKLWGKPHGSFGEFCWQNDKVTRGFP